ncbi:MAG TPA: GNAT family N-acetyltransferase [Thermoleophilaceae bacterium]
MTEPLGDGEVALREWRRDDMHAMIAMLDDEPIVRWTRVPSPYGERDALDYLARGDAERERGEGINLGIFDAAGREVLGSMSVRIASWPDLRGQLGYLVGAHARGRGVAPRAIRLASAWGFRKLGLERIEILVHPDNEPSQRAAEKAGFRREGILRSYTRVKAERFDMWSFSALPGELERAR